MKKITYMFVVAIVWMVSLMTINKLQETKWKEISEHRYTEGYFLGIEHTQDRYNIPMNER